MWVSCALNEDLSNANLLSHRDLHSLEAPLACQGISPSDCRRSFSQYQRR